MIKLLIVDDEVSICKPIKQFFDSKNYEVAMVHRGEDALKYIEKERPHLVFLDIGLPDASGLDILREIKDFDKTIKVIMITAYGNEEMIKQAKTLGVSEYIKKPFTLDYLQEEGMMKVQRELFEELREQHEKEYRIRKMFQKYVPADMVSRVLNDSEKIFTGKRVKATILMCDIRNSTALTRKLSPEDVVNLLNDYFREMSVPIYSNGGIVDKYIGDAIMGVFGVPSSKDDDAKNAVKTAWVLMERLAEFNKKNREKYGELVIGIGINTGEVVAGNIGFEEKMDYTVIGDVVHKTSEIEEISKAYPNGILISESTLKEVEDIVEVENLGVILYEREEVIYRVEKIMF
ncbi:response regulator [Elusimicrobiota bacterium]